MSFRQQNSPDARGLTRSLGSLRDLEDDIRHALTFVFSGV
jgi:hypothetical protein